MIQRFALLIILVSAVQLSTAEESPNPSKLIEQMARSATELDYEGVFIYRSGSGMQTMQVIHKSTDKGGMEKLVSLSGEAKEVIRDNNAVRCIMPESKTVIMETDAVDQFISRRLPYQLETLTQQYEFKLAGQDRVANRNAWVLDIIPKDDYRYGYQLWLDKETSLLLKSEQKSRVGMTIEQMMFTQIDINKVIDEAKLKASYLTDDFEVLEHKTTKSSYGNTLQKWVIDWMPEGFSTKDVSTQTMPNSNHSLQHVLLSDGLTTISVFIEKVHDDMVTQSGSQSMGTANTYAKIDNGYQITALGGVPLATVKLIANSVKMTN